MSEQVKSREKEVELLLEIADVCSNGKSMGKKTASERNLKSKLSQLLVSPFFIDYKLEEKDIKIIAILLSQYFKNDDEDEMKTRDVLKILEKDTKTIFRELKRIEKLNNLGILEVEKQHRHFGRRFLEDTEEAEEDKISGIWLLRAPINLSKKFLTSMFDTDKKTRRKNLNPHSRKTTSKIIEPYKDNLEYLVDQFEKIKILREDDNEPFMPFHHRFRRPRRNARMLEFNHKQDREVLKKLEDRISQRLEKTARKFPFEEFKKKKSLTKKEELIIITLLENEVTEDDPCEISDILNLISKTTYERLTDRKLFEKDGRLVKEKIIEIHPQRRFFSETTFLKLNSNLKTELLEEKKIRKNTLELKEDDFFEVVKPSISLDKVILHPETFEEINIALGMIQGNTSNILREWGIKGSNLLRNKSGKKTRQSVTMLFHGAPGTGKTLTAHAIAGILKRKLITFDCSKILDMWVGESEKNTRKIFDRYREIAGNMKNPPVLLLNEADQFFHKRIHAARAVDHMHNQMQNIFLEQLEQFEGILIATTNLVDNLDSAFSRRFHYKIEFRRPRTEERFNLWKVHIPEKAPLSEDVNLKYLAEHYDFSGAQIALAISNAATRAARRGDKICHEDFIKACENEVLGNFDEKAKGKAGFQIGQQ